MPIFREGDVHFYAEFSDGWDRYCRTPHKKWGYTRRLPENVINYWRDLDGAAMENVTKNDLYFDKWLRRRINPRACLPLYYSVGHRFIRLTKAYPVGFKCAPMPLSLIEARHVKAKLRAEARRLAKEKAELDKIRAKIKAKERALKREEKDK